MTEILTIFFLLSGSLFFLISAVGVLKFPDVFTRMHAASKASSLGMSLLLAAATLHFASVEVAVKSLLILLFIFLTTPVAAHILGRAAYLTGAKKWDRTSRDEIRDLYKSKPTK